MRFFWLMLVATILMTYFLFFEPKPKQSSYVPKSQRSKSKQVLRKCTNILLKPLLKAWNNLDERICKMKTKRRRKYYHPTTYQRKKGQRLPPFIILQSSIEGQPIEVRFDTDSKKLRVDNGASRCISPHIEDFIDVPKDTNRSILGILGSTNSNKEGTIEWKIEDDEGKTHIIHIPGSLYVPGATSRLLSPQHWAQTAKDNAPNSRGTWSGTYDDCIEMWWDQCQYKRTVPLDPNETNVGTIMTAPGYTRYHAFAAEMEEPEGDGYDEDLTYEPNVVTEDEGNGSSDEMESEDESRDDPLTMDFDLNGPSEAPVTEPIEDEEDIMPQDDSAKFLRWHHRLGHLSPTKIKLLAKDGILPKKLANCRVPMCTSCIFGKATKRPWRSKTRKSNGNKITKITEPGQCVSVDQLESSTPGLVAQMRGIPTIKRYKGATIFVDQHSGLSYVHLQKTLSGAETVEAKEAFERYARSHGVQVAHYHADNGRFADNKWRKACADNGQVLTFCGVNAHFQNGIAERRIRELQEQARTMLIHANKRWPETINAHLWPYAIRMANDLYNATPDLARKHVPMEAFLGTKVTMNPNHWSHFGCPVYVLDNNLQAGKKINKWQYRARVGCYLGQSPQHARTVALVLSLETGLVSPQFHVQMDTTFQTMRHSFGATPPRSQWMAKCHFIKDEVELTRKRKRSNPVDIKRQDSAERQDREVSTSSRRKDVRTPGLSPTGQDPDPLDSSAKPRERFQREDKIHPRSQRLPNAAVVEQTKPGPVPEHGQDPTVGLEPTTKFTIGTDPMTDQFPMTDPESIGARVKQRQEEQRLIEAFAMEIEMEQPCYVPYEVMQVPNTEVDDEMEHPLFAFKAKSDPDTMYLHEALKQPDRNEFIRAMDKELQDQLKHGNFTLVHRNTVPEGATILPTVWAMRRKRKQDTGEVYKYKGRLNVDGSKQTKGVNYWETFAPVATWGSIRFILVLSLIHNWKTRQIDYVQAYPQAEVPLEDLYVKVPKGIEVESGNQNDYVMKVNKNVYGTHQAGRVWNKHLVAKLKSIGFKQSEIDECVFYRGQSMYVLYTDDSILVGPDDKELDDIIEDMQTAGLALTVDGKIEDFLGVNIDRRDDGTIHLTQHRLIDQILKEMRLYSDNVSVKTTPAPVSKILK